MKTPRIKTVCQVSYMPHSNISLYIIADYEAVGENEERFIEKICKRAVKKLVKSNKELIYEKAKNAVDSWIGDIELGESVKDVCKNALQSAVSDIMDSIDFNIEGIKLEVDGATVLFASNMEDVIEKDVAYLFKQEYYSDLDEKIWLMVEKRVKKTVKPIICDFLKSK